MQGSVSIRVLLIEISLFIYQGLYDLYLKPHHRQMHWTPEDAASQVDIGTTVD